MILVIIIGMHKKHSPIIHGKKFNTVNYFQYAHSY